MTALTDVKESLRITHDADDKLLLRLISSATREYFAFVNPAELPGDPAVVVPNPPDGTAFVPEDAFNGIVLIVQADYDGDPEKRATYRKAAESLWMPYRLGMGL